MNTKLCGKQPLVSVCVITYNHASYIEKCLQSIAEQHCDFSWEVIIRDDASPDGTAAIVDSFIYNRKLDNFHLIALDENEGMGQNFANALRLCRGDYIAICEGDDYWNDENKLQLQVRAMLNNKHCALSVHPCFLYKTEDDNQGLGSYMGPVPFEFDGQDVLDIEGKFAPTVSYMVRRDVVNRLPIWFSEAPVCDYLIEMYAMISGTGLYLPKTMSTYRVFSPGSWSDRIRSDSGIKMKENGRDLFQLHTKLANSQEFSSLDFSVKLASSELSYALGCLLLGQDSLFQKHIGASFRASPFSITQRACYIFRAFPRFVRFMFRLKRWVYMAMKVK